MCGSQRKKNKKKHIVAMNKYICTRHDRDASIVSESMKKTTPKKTTGKKRQGQKTTI